MGKRGPPPKLIRRFANEQIGVLLDLADQRINDGNEELALRYVELVQAISRKSNIPLGERQYCFCRACKLPYGGSEQRVRLRNGKQVVTCLRCGALNRRRPLHDKGDAAQDP